MRLTVRLYKFVCLFAAVATLSCNTPPDASVPDRNAILPEALGSLTDVIIRDIYTPPVASRIYAYTQLAYYEAIRFSNDTSGSITAKLKGFGKMPAPDRNKKYDYTLAAVSAFFEVGRSLVFSRDSLTQSENSILNQYFNGLSDSTRQNSVQLGKSIAAVVVARSKADHYTSTRGMPRFSVFKKDGQWRQTSPDYADAVEPYWSSISPLLLDSASQYKPPRPPAFDMNKNSRYYKELLEVYEVTRDLTPQQDSIATYWDDNAFVTSHEGHLLYANKKTTPVGHWMGITSIVCSQQKTDEVTTARIYALTASAIFDGFIACWDEKFRSSTVRPITVIQEQFEDDWTSFLQTPSFPEYTSGHSVISSAAAMVLTAHLGNGIAFTDTTEMQYLGLKRSFSSIEAAAEEAGISRLYGGIHFRAAIVEGSRQGKGVGTLYNRIFLKH